MTDNNPRTDPVGTVRTREGRTAVKAAMGDDSGKGGHVWLGITDGTVRVYHHADVRSWAVEAGDSTPTGWVALAGQLVGTACDGATISHWPETVYDWDGRFFADKQEAIDATIKRLQHDDFNIGRVEDGCLVWFGWMDEKHPEEDYPEVAKQFGWTAADRGRRQHSSPL